MKAPTAPLSLPLTSSVGVDQVPPGLTTYVSSQGQIIVPQANEGDQHL